MISKPVILNTLLSNLVQRQQLNSKIGHAHKTDCLSKFQICIWDQNSLYNLDRGPSGITLTYQTSSSRKLYSLITQARGIVKEIYLS